VPGCWHVIPSTFRPPFKAARRPASRPHTFSHPEYRWRSRCFSVQVGWRLAVAAKLRCSSGMKSLVWKRMFVGTLLRTGNIHTRGSPSGAEDVAEPARVYFNHVLCGHGPSTPVRGARRVQTVST